MHEAIRLHIEAQEAAIKNQMERSKARRARRDLEALVEEDEEDDAGGQTSTSMTVSNDQGISILCICTGGGRGEERKTPLTGRQARSTTRKLVIPAPLAPKLSSPSSRNSFPRRTKVCYSMKRVVPHSAFLQRVLSAKEYH